MQASSVHLTPCSTGLSLLGRLQDRGLAPGQLCFLYTMNLSKSLPLSLRLPPSGEQGVRRDGLLGAKAILPVIPLVPGNILWPSEIPDTFFSLPRYLNNQVFVSLANGELVVYQREAGECPLHRPLPSAYWW